MSVDVVDREPWNLRLADQVFAVLTPVLLGLTGISILLIAQLPAEAHNNSYAWIGVGAAVCFAYLAAMCAAFALDSQRNVRAMFAYWRDGLSALGVRWPASRAQPVRLLLALVVVPVVVVALDVGPLWKLTLHLTGYQLDSGQVAANADRLTWFSSGWAGHIPGLILVCAVIAEEILYRGALLIIVNRVAAGRSRWIGVSIVLLAYTGQAVWFGMVHSEYSAANAVSAAFSGLSYGAMALWSRSLLPSIISHSLHNWWVLS